MDTAHLATLFADHYGQAIASGPLTSGTMSLTGVTLDLELTDGSDRNTTIALANSNVGVITQGVDAPNSVVGATFAGRCKTVTITEQVTA